MTRETDLETATSHSVKQAVSVVMLKTGNGRFVSSSFSFDAPVTISETPADLFEMTDLGSGVVALKSARSGKYVTADPKTGVAANRQEIGPSEQFTVIPVRDGMMAFQLRQSACYLSTTVETGASLSAAATNIGPAESFLIEPVTLAGSSLDLGDGPHCCCGPRRSDASQASLMWNDNSHKEMVKTAIDLLGGGPRGDRKPVSEEASRIIALWDNGAGFDTKVLQGLEDADYKDPWRGTWVGLDSMYNDHFYNPATGTNYLGNPSSALTEGRRWFHLSVHLGRRIAKLGPAASPALFEKAGHYLGLSLHFLTDLTQPMHAANFTNVYGGSFPIVSTTDFRHKGFEHYAEAKVNEGYFKCSRLEPADWDLKDISGVASFLHSVAVDRKRIFDHMVVPELAKKVNHTTPPSYRSHWSEEADPILAQALLPGPRIVARYLAYWAWCIIQPLNIDHGMWYRIKEPTRNEYVNLKNGCHVRSNDKGDNSLFYFLFNEDGTVTLACKGWMRNPWYVWQDYWDKRFYISEYKNAERNPHQQCRFRVVPEPDGKVWFFESTIDEVVDVASNGSLVRWNPCEPTRQLFTLEPVEAISESDKQKIKHIWPHYGTYNWWGGNS